MQVQDSYSRYSLFKIFLFKIFLSVITTVERQYLSTPFDSQCSQCSCMYQAKAKLYLDIIARITTPKLKYKK